MSAKGFDETIWLNVVKGTPALRYHILEREPMYFAAYYFPEYFKFEIPDFHYDLYDDFKALANGEIDEALWCHFRGAAKTSIAKLLVIWVICYKKKSYIGWDSYDGDNAGAALFDITLALQTNKKLISDFGHLYYQKKAKQAFSEAKMKRINQFITENGVKVVTFTTQEAIRGQLQGHERLDFMVFDDFENNKTKDSPVKTEGIIEHINEYRGGMPAGAAALYLGNYLTDSGSVAFVKDNLEDNERARVRFVPVLDEHKRIAWPAKYTKTRDEALEYNRNIKDPKLHKISLDAAKESLSKDGLVFETEMMLNPAKSGDLFFDRVKVNKAIRQAVPPLEENAGLKIWAKFNPRHRYGGGADTAEGIGGDHNAAVWMDFTQKPNTLVASFQDNELSNTQFGWELKREGALYGYPYIIPEINNTGYGTISELINAEYPLIYQREQKNATTGQIKKEYGWKATVGTVFEAMSAFKEGFESGELEILDADLLKEMRGFTKSKARAMGSGRQKGVTRHFDKLRAAALAWEGRRWSEVKTETPYVQPPYEPTSEFESSQSQGRDDNTLPPWMHEVT